MFNFRRWATVFVALCMLLAPALLAQVTTGNIAGTVSAKQDNSELPVDVKDRIEEMRADYEHQLDARYAGALRLAR